MVSIFKSISTSKNRVALNIFWGEKKKESKNDGFHEIIVKEPMVINVVI